MRTSPSPLSLLILGCIAICAAVPAEAKQSSTITLGTVNAGGSSYRQGARLSSGTVVSTDSSKTAEMVTPSAATLRLGRATSASLDKGSAQVFRGSVLVSSASGIVGRRSENVAAGPVTVDCNGSVLVAANAGSTKVTCLEGSAVVRLRERRGQFLKLEAGSMVMVDGDATEVPVPVEIDLDRLTRTAGLLGSPFGELRTERGIRKAIDKQQREMARGKLLASSVTVSGSGGETSVGDSTSGGGQSDSASSGGSSSGSSSGGGSSSVGSSSGRGGGAVASTGGSLSSATACA
jgi:hypothetical protein